MTEICRASINEINKASSTVEFSKKKSGVSLGLGSGDPLEARSYSAIFSASFAKDTTTVAADHAHDDVKQCFCFRFRVLR